MIFKASPRPKALLTTLFCAFATFNFPLTAMSAEETIAALCRWEPFKGYPKNPREGDRGNRILSSRFTGKWYCATIGEGTLGRHSNIPFGPPTLPIIDEKVVAIALVDIESGKTKLIRITKAHQPKPEHFSLCIRSKSEISCAMCGGIADAAEKYDVLDVMLDENNLILKQMSFVEVLKHITRSVLPAKVYDGKEESLGKMGSKNIWPLISSDLVLIDLTDSGRLARDGVNDRQPALKQIFPGSRPGRVVECQRAEAGEFLISERSIGLQERVYYQLSEETFEADKTSGRILRIWFPVLAVAPLQNIVMLIEEQNNTCTLVRIWNGRVKNVAQFSNVISPLAFVMSESQEVVAVELLCLDDRQVAQSINIKTGNAVDISAENNVEMHSIVGITNSGAIIEESTREVFVNDVEKAPKSICCLIFEP